MSVLALPMHEPERTRTGLGMTASVTLHALLLAWLILFPHRERAGDPITEITLLDPGELSGSTAAAPAAALVAAPGVITAAPKETRFRRETPRASLAPAPQLESATEDRLNSRLAAMQSTAVRPSLGTVPSAPASLLGSAPATIAAPGSGGAPIALARGGAGGGAALELARGGGHDLAPALGPTAAPIERPTAAAPVNGEASARRMLAGAMLLGPIADRPILSHVTPVYPDWAKREGIEGSVTLYFVVRPDGSVRENVLVQKTAGFGDFDENACTALRAWLFEPLRGGRVGEQWGTITFHFRLRDG